LKESLQRPKILVSDFVKLDRPQQLHVAMQALHRFWELHGSLPEPWNKEHAQQMVQLAHEINSKSVQKVCTQQHWISLLFLVSGL
jgi:ubiquitin-activating enzyme E1